MDSTGDYGPGWGSPLCFEVVCIEKINYFSFLLKNKLDTKIMIMLVFKNSL